MFWLQRKMICSHSKKVCLHTQKIPRQIFAVNSDVNFPRQIAKENYHGKKLRRIPTVKNYGKMSRQIAAVNWQINISNICEGLPTMSLFTQNKNEFHVVYFNLAKIDVNTCKMLSFMILVFCGKGLIN